MTTGVDQKKHTLDDIAERLTTFGNILVKKAIILQIIGGTSGKHTFSGWELNSYLNILLVGECGQEMAHYDASKMFVDYPVILDDEIVNVKKWFDRFVETEAEFYIIPDLASLPEKYKEELAFLIKAKMFFDPKLNKVRKISHQFAILAAVDHESFELLSPNLLSSFDLIFHMHDKELDFGESENYTRFNLRQLCDEIEGPNLEISNGMPFDDLRDLVQSLKNKTKPKLSKSSCNEIILFIEKLDSTYRKSSRLRKIVLTVVNLSEAHAKFRMADTVTSDDVKAILPIVLKGI